MAISSMIPLMVAAMLALFAVLCAVLAPRLPVPIRLLAACLLLPVLLFSVFGFLASFEPGDGQWKWTAAYVFVFLGCSFAIARLVFIRRPSAHDSETT